MIDFWISMHIHRMSIYSLVCPPIILSVCPSFCPSVYPSVHLYVCSHIVKMAQSIAKSSKINLKSIVQIIHKMKKILKRKLHWKAPLLFVHTCFSLLISYPLPPFLSLLKFCKIKGPLKVYSIKFGRIITCSYINAGI